MSHWLRQVVVVCLCCVMMAALSPRAWSQSQGLRTERLVHHFDFEEARLGNFEALPQHWYVMGRPANNADPNFVEIPLHRELVNRPGYPHFTEVGFNHPQHEPGPHSFAMKLDGGNVGAFLEMGAVPAVAMSQYLVAARVRTAGLQRAGARMTAYLVDGQGRRIDQSLTRSPLIRSEGQWQTISLHLQGDFPTAAWIGLELELLQPQPDPASPLGREQIILEDIHGQAWWDDIAIWQLPQVSVQTQNPVNIICLPHRPVLTVSVRDLTGHALMSEMKIYDAQGELVDRITRSSGSGQAAQWQCTPKLDKLGWYVADLSVYDTDSDQRQLLPGVIARSVTSFLWLPPSQPLAALDKPPFMLLATGAPAGQLALMPQMLRQTGLSSIMLSLWDRKTTLATLPQRQQQLEEVINPIISQGGRVTLSMTPAPTDLLHAMDLTDSSILSMWTQDRSQWQPYLLDLLMRHGQSVSHWSLGSATRGISPLLRDLPEQSLAAYRGLQSLAPDPHIILPWSIQYARRSDVTTPASYLLDVPYAVQAEHLGQYLQPWMQPPQVQTWLTLREPSPSEMSHEDRLVDLSLRMIHAWEAGAGGLAINKPWAWTTPRQRSLMPDSLLGAFAQISQRLAGRRAIGRLDVGQGLNCIIFDGPAGGMLALWNQSSPQTHLDLYLGQSPQIVDLWGNRTPLALVGGRHHLPVSRQPVFIEGIDAKLAVMRSRFKLDEPFIESTQTPHRRVLTLTNPWPRTITGSLNILGPEDWRIQPRQSSFSIAPGQTLQIPVQMIFPVSEVAGHKRLSARVEFTADHPYQADFHAPMQLGLRHIHFDASVTYRRGDRPGQVDAVVRQFVTNQGDKPVSLYAFVQTAGFPRQEGIISRLNPGQSIIRRFVIEDVTRQGPLDQPLRVGLRETRGPAVLNDMLRLMPPVVEQTSNARP